MIDISVVVDNFLQKVSKDDTYGKPKPLVVEVRARDFEAFSTESVILTMTRYVSSPSYASLTWPSPGGHHCLWLLLESLSDCTVPSRTERRDGSHPGEQYLAALSTFAAHLVVTHILQVETVTDKDDLFKGFSIKRLQDLVDVLPKDCRDQLQQHQGFFGACKDWGISIVVFNNIFASTASIPLFCEDELSRMSRKRIFPVVLELLQFILCVFPFRQAEHLTLFFSVTTEKTVPLRCM